MNNPLDSIEITVPSAAGRGEVAELTHTLSSLLAEYSAKLSQLIAEQEGIFFRYWLSFAIWIVVSLSLFLFVALSAQADKNWVWSTRSYTLISLLCILIIIITGIPATRFAGQEIKKKRAMRFNIRVTRQRLERVVRAASQFQEHGKVKELDFARRLELNLRLGEAEAALRHSYVVVPDNERTQKSAGFKTAEPELTDDYEQTALTQKEKTAPVH